MKTIKVSEATELQLDWLVAKCMVQDHEDQLTNSTTTNGWWIPGLFVDPNHRIRTDEFRPSSNWSQGGPIIEREGISIIFHEQGHWTASNLHGTVCVGGPTPLIAAMRCYVTSKLGDTVEVPEELL